MTVAAIAPEATWTMACDECGTRSYIPYVREKTAILELLPWWLWFGASPAVYIVCLVLGVVGVSATKLLQIARIALNLIKFLVCLPKKMLLYSKDAVATVTKKLAFYGINSSPGRVVVWILRSLTRLNRRAVAYVDRQAPQYTPDESHWPLCGPPCGVVCTLKSTAAGALITPLTIMVGRLSVLEHVGSVIHRYGCNRSHHHRNGHATSPRKTRPRRKLSPQKQYPTTVIGRVMLRSKRFLGLTAALPQLSPETMGEMDRECCRDPVCECDKKRKYEDMLTDSESDCEENLLNFDESNYVSEEDATFLPGETSSDSLEYHEGETESEPETDPHHVIRTGDITSETAEIITDSRDTRMVESELYVSETSIKVAGTQPSHVPMERSSNVGATESINNESMLSPRSEITDDEKNKEAQNDSSNKNSQLADSGHQKGQMVDESTEESSMTEGSSKSHEETSNIDLTADASSSEGQVAEKGCSKNKMAEKGCSDQAQVAEEDNDKGQVADEASDKGKNAVKCDHKKNDESVIKDYVVIATEHDESSAEKCDSDVKKCHKDKPGNRGTPKGKRGAAHPKGTTATCSEVSHSKSSHHKHGHGKGSHSHATCTQGSGGVGGGGGKNEVVK